MAGEKSTDLITDQLLDQIVVVLGEQLPRFNAFQIEAVQGPLQLKEASVASYLIEKSGTRPDVETPVTAETDDIDFQPAESATNTAISLNTKYFWNSVSRTYAEALAGIPINTMVPLMVKTLREELWDELTELLVVANFPTELPSIAVGDFGDDDLKDMWALLPESGPLAGVFTKAAYANLLPTNLESFQTNTTVGAGWGIDAQFYPVENFTGAAGTESCYGFLTHPQAIMGAWGVPYQTPEVGSARQVNETVITDDMTGANFLLTEWIDAQTKTQWMSLGIVAGFAVGDSTALCRVQINA